MNQIELVNELRQRLDQIVLDGEIAYTDQNVKENALSFFSDEDLIQRLSDGTRFVASQVRAEYLSGYIETIDPFEGSSDNPPLFYRLLGSRVYVEDENAKRTTFGSIRKFHDTHCPDGCNPIYVFEDFELKIYNEEINPVGSKAFVIGIPKEKIKEVEGPFIFENATNLLGGINSEDEGGLIKLYDAFNNVIFTTYIIKDDFGRYVLKDIIPQNFYDSSKYEILIGAFHSLDRSLRPFIIDYALASALGSMSLYEQAVMAQQRMMLNLEKYMYSRRNSKNAL